MHLFMMQPELFALRNVLLSLSFPGSLIDGINFVFLITTINMKAEMKKLLTIVMILCIGAGYSCAFGQDAKTQKENKKGGFAVGGYDNTRQEEKSTVTKRSVVIPEEAEPAEKSVEEAATPVPTQAPVAAPQAPETNAGKPVQGNKEIGQAPSQDTKSKQKAKKNSKAKSKRK